MTIRERHMDTRLGRMAWLEAGAGWPVVLLHGFPLNAGMWRPQLERVPEGSRFIAPDFPGFGRSEPRRVPGNGLGLYAAAVGDLMDALELDDAVIAGLSMGGYVAFEMYRQLPGRFAGPTRPRDVPAAPACASCSRARGQRGSPIRCSRNCFPARRRPTSWPQCAR
jgi:alpha-beta hydrolase superfamily lysophospholipase